MLSCFFFSLQQKCQIYISLKRHVFWARSVVHTHALFDCKIYGIVSEFRINRRRASIFSICINM